MNHEKACLEACLGYVKMIPTIQKAQAQILLTQETRLITQLHPRKNTREFVHPEFFATIQRIGICNPIAIDTNNNIIDGMVRFQAAKAAGHMKVPVRVV